MLPPGEPRHALAVLTSELERLHVAPFNSGRLPTSISGVLSGEGTLSRVTLWGAGAPISHPGSTGGRGTFSTGAVCPLSQCKVSLQETVG